MLLNVLKLVKVLPLRANFSPGNNMKSAKPNLVSKALWHLFFAKFRSLFIAAMKSWVSTQCAFHSDVKLCGINFKQTFLFLKSFSRMVLMLHLMSSSVPIIFSHQMEATSCQTCSIMFVFLVVFGWSLFVSMSSLPSRKGKTILKHEYGALFHHHAHF